MDIGFGDKYSSNRECGESILPITDYTVCVLLESLKQSSTIVDLILVIDSIQMACGILWEAIGTFAKRRQCALYNTLTPAPLLLHYLSMVHQ